MNSMNKNQESFALSTAPIEVINGSLESFIIKLINVAYRSKKIECKKEAGKAIMSEEFIQKSKQCFLGWQTSNTKLFDSSNRGRVLIINEIKDDDYYVHSRSISGKRFCYAKNGSLNRIQKWLFTEYQMNGKITCVALELASRNQRMRKILSNIGISSHDLYEIESEAEKAIIESKKIACIVDGQQILLRGWNNQNIAVTPISNHKTQSQIHKRLVESDFPKLTTTVYLGYGISVATSGSLASDTGGRLRIFKTGDIYPVSKIKILYHKIENNSNLLPSLKINIDEIDCYRVYTQSATGDAIAFLNIKHRRKIRFQVKTLVGYILDFIFHFKRTLKKDIEWRERFKVLINKIEDECTDLTYRKKLGFNNLLLIYVLETVELNSNVVESLTDKIHKHLILSFENLLPKNITQYIHNDIRKALTSGIKK